MTNDIRSVYMTFPDEATAASISSALLGEGLIACANVFPAGRSLYRWEGAVQDEPEVVAIAKSSAGLLEELVKRVAEMHPYDVPCVVALPAVGGDERYLAWVNRETGASGN